MTREQWFRVKTITADALDQPEPQRRAFVMAACAGDAGLEHEVASLLSCTIRATPLFEPPRVAALDDPPLGSPRARLVLPPGTIIGRYRLTGEIGRGGMGVVYLAQRADQTYEQRVALKIVDYPQSADALQWFRDERQILATLDHPNIARLLDGGTTDNGLPYLVMEYVDGDPVDVYCRGCNLTIRARIDLFLQICAAVELAHRHLVVHRDLKPRNILVQDGVPKLLDFGVATWLDAAARGTSLAPPPLLTPEYAAPEQLTGAPVTTATDVFALGVLLFRLLTGRGPAGDDDGHDRRPVAEVMGGQPPRPSEIVTAGARRRQLAGDLDAIVLQALQPDPDARYASAGALADDLRRYLAGLPVQARHGGSGYRAARFARRHAVAAIAAVLVMVSAAVGVVTTVRQARETERQRARAQAHFDEVRQLANTLIFEVHDSLVNVAGAIQARQLIAERARAYFDRLAADEPNDVALQREVATAYDRLGDVLGRAYGANTGDSAAALASYRKALAIRERLAGRATDDRQARLDAWTSAYNIGGLLRERADTRGALALHERARDLLEPLVAAAPADAGLRRRMAQTAATLGVSYVQAGRFEAAREAATRALDLQRQLLASAPADPVARHDVATALGRLGQIELKLDDTTAARRHFDEAYAIAQAIVEAQPENVAFERRLSSTHAHLAQWLARAGDLAAAWPHQEAVLAVRRSLVERNPGDRQAAIDLMVAQLETGQLLDRRGRHADAAVQFGLAIDRAESLVARDPSYVYYRLVLATALTRLARAQLADPAADATARTQRAATMMASAAEADPVDARVQYELAMAYATLGDLAAAARAAVSATARQPMYDRSLAILQAMRRNGLRGGGAFDADEASVIARLTPASSAD